MTLTKHSLVNIKDLLAISLLCGCGSSSTVNLLQFKNIPEHCPNCKKDWYLERTHEHKSIELLVETIEDFRKRSATAPCQILLMVNDSVDEPTHLQ